MKYYVLVDDKRIKCLFDYETIIILFERLNDWKIVNRTWVDVCSIDAKDNIVDTFCCYICLSEFGDDWTDGTRRFDIICRYSKTGENIKSIEIVAHALTNFFNIGSDNRNVGQIYKTNIKIGTIDYLLTVSNESDPMFSIDFMNRNLISTRCLVTCKEFISNDELLIIIKYFKRLLQFVTIGTETDIGTIKLIFQSNRTTYLIMNESSESVSKKEKHYIPFLFFGENKDNLFDFVNHYFRRPYAVFFNEKSGFHESQIPSVIGEFEYIFDKTIKNDSNYKLLIKKKKEIIHYSDLKKTIVKFQKDHNIKDEDYSDFMSLFSAYSIPLKERIDYVFKEMVAILNLKPYDFGFGRTVVDFANRQSAVRTGIAHGRNNNVSEVVKSIYTIEIFQELIYYMIVKYSIKCSNEEIRNIFNCYYFKSLNLECSLLEDK